jgi:hypothetical protein
MYPAIPIRRRAEGSPEPKKKKDALLIYRKNLIIKQAAPKVLGITT